MTKQESGTHSPLSGRAQTTKKEEGRGENSGYSQETGVHIVSRQIGREHHKPYNKESLLNRLNKSARADAILKLEGDGLLSTIVDGIDGGELTEKVIIGLCQVLAEQNNLFPGMQDMKQLRANTENILHSVFSCDECAADSLVGGTPHAGEPVVISSNGEKLPISLRPFIQLKIADFTRRIKGLPKNTKVDSKDKNAVRAILDDLRRKTLYTLSNSHWIGTTLIGRVRICINDTTQEEVRIMELDSVFTRGLLNDYITLPFDLLQRLRGRQKKITMRLMWYLVEQRSYHLPTYPHHQVDKQTLFSGIAIIKKYDTHPALLNSDFAEAIKKMNEIRLISNYEERSGKTSSSTICIFTFSEDFLETHIENHNR